ncbi:T9SS type A sorting domain-containing protein [Crocinitomix catalasitica]|nr:T9SS type A sorting domain-containing protein [Crocinitomix catalasitica]
MIQNFVFVYLDMRLFVIVLLISSSSYSQLLTDSLVFHYLFDGDMTDYGSYGFDATGSATLTPDRFGSPNRAYLFEGAEWMDLPNDPLMKPNLPVSFSYWIRLDGPDTQNHHIIGNEQSSGAYYGVSSTIYAGTAAPTVAFGQGFGGCAPSTRRSMYGTISIDDGLWHHVVVICRSGLDMEIWVDCVKDSLATYGGSGAMSTGYSSGQGYIGRVWDCTSAYAYAEVALDDICMWKRDLNISDIDVLCNEGQSTNEIETAQKGDFLIFPNPVLDGRMNIQTARASSDYKIINSLGQVIQAGEMEPEIIVDGLSTGIYFFVAISDEDSITRRLIIE